MAINKKYLDLEGLEHYEATIKSRLGAEANTRMSTDNTLQAQINGLASGSPLVASSTSGMTDTTRVYVNTTDGHWYYYNGGAWTDGGVYQATEDSDTVKLLEDSMRLIYPIYPYVYPTIDKGEPTVGQTGVSDSVFRYSSNLIPTKNQNVIKLTFNNKTQKDFTFRLYYFDQNGECTQQGSYFEVLSGNTVTVDYTMSTVAVDHDYIMVSGRSKDTVNLTNYYAELEECIKFTYVSEEDFVLENDEGDKFNNVIARLANDESRIGILESGQPSGFPDYYQSQLTSAVSQINTNMDEVGQHGDTFAFVTDTHWSNNTKHSPALLAYLKNKCNFRFVVHGGDYITGGTDIPVWTENLRVARDAWDIFDNDFLTLFGNHDANNDKGSQYRISVNAVYDILFKRCESSITEWNNSAVEEINPYSQFYYYVDNNITKTRNFYLSSSHGSIGARQLNWLSSKLNEVPTGWHCVVFCHWIFVDGSYTPNGTQLKNICDQHADKVMAIIAGHIHYDKVDYTTAGIPIIFTTTDTHYPVEDEQGVTPDATVGTINEQAFDVMTVNYQTGTIKCVRIGRGADRTVQSHVGQ